MLKVTSINKYGVESTPTSVWINPHGYIELPYDPHAVWYALYAPFFDQSETGPWYLVRAISRREAKAARQTVVGTYKQANLIAKLCPPDGELTFPDWQTKIALPESVDGQCGWFIYGGFSPSAPASMWVEVNPRSNIGV